MLRFAIELELTLGDDGRWAALRVRVRVHARFREESESGSWANGSRSRGLTTPRSPRMRSRMVNSSGPRNVRCLRSPYDRLYLANAAGLPAFRDAYDALVGMNFYQFKPESMRAMQTPNEGNDRVLDKDGGNIAGVIGRMGREQPEVKEQRILGYLKAILPDLVDVDRVFVPAIDLETVKFVQKAPGPNPRQEFFASSMSDGTLRALGTLVAVIQPAEGASSCPVGRHRGAGNGPPPGGGGRADGRPAGKAAVQTQVIVTTHSPDLLDLVDLETDRLLVVQMRDGETEIGRGRSREPRDHQGAPVLARPVAQHGSARTRSERP